MVGKNFVPRLGPARDLFPHTCGLGSGRLFAFGRPGYRKFGAVWCSACSSQEFSRRSLNGTEVVLSDSLGIPRLNAALLLLWDVTEHGLPCMARLEMPCNRVSNGQCLRSMMDHAKFRDDGTFSQLYRGYVNDFTCTNWGCFVGASNSCVSLCKHVFHCAQRV